MVMQFVLVSSDLLFFPENRYLSTFLHEADFAIERGNME